VEYDVTLFILTNESYSFVLGTDSDDAAVFSSREGSQPPQLVILLADGPTATATIPEPTVTATPTPTQPPSNSIMFITDSDARVRESNPERNYGTSSTLQADNDVDPDIESFVRFTVTGVEGRVLQARLRLFVTTNGSRNGPAVYSTDLSWTELGINWYTRPARTSGAVDNKDRVRTNTWVDYDVTSLVPGNGTYSFVLAADSSDSVVFSSREGIRPPQLVVTYTGGPTPTPTPTLPPGEVIFVGAGDISDCETNNDELTAQLLDAIPGTVFTTGDNVYPSGTYNEYINCYGPAWGRHKERTQPVPGNHEYLTSGAAGYFQYFNNIPSYYAYNLGSWRIYALNSEINTSANSAQVAWLLADVAANPSQCALAYWHRPRWSSGTHHGGDEKYQVLWEILYEAGAELVLNGHEHHYERFAEMDALGREASPGLREIVVGTGGRSLYDFGPPLPASEIRNASAFGVLKLILRPDGYDWQFVSVPSSAFTDSGSAECH
jgi:hypothetical protein